MGTETIASSRPVLAWSTITSPLTALAVFTCWAIARWATYWISRLRESWTLWPGTASVTTSSADGMAWPWAPVS